jgi:hypothetical protein
MTVAIKDIHKFDCRYHRNGVSGEGFFACSFIYGRGKQAKNMTAVVFPVEVDGQGEEYRKCTAVMTVGDVADRWRGDHFDGALREHIAAFKEKTGYKAYE